MNVISSPPASMGWATCPQCESPFLSVVGARVRCPLCGHVFCVESVELARPGGLDESKPSGKQWLLRIEIQVARAWAEASEARRNSDAADFLKAWTQIKAFRFGQRIDFQYERRPGLG